MYYVTTETIFIRKPAFLSVIGCQLIFGFFIDAIGKSAIFWVHIDLRKPKKEQ